MGDLRFEPFYQRIRTAPEPLAELRSLDTEGLIQALAASSRQGEPYLANVLATELLNRHRQITAATRAIGDGVFATDLDGRITMMNAAGERLLGWRQGEVLGEPFAMFCGANGACAPLIEAVKAAAEWRGEVWLSRPDGELFAADVTTSPILHLEEPVGTVVVFRDRTEANKAEAERTALLARERAARSEAEEARRRATILAEAAHALTVPFEFRRRLEALGRAAVPAIADGCAILLRDETTPSRLHLAFATSVDGRDSALFEHERESGGRVPAAIARVLESGKPHFATRVDELADAGKGVDAEERETLARVGAVSTMVARLEARGTPIGVLVLWSTRNERRYTRRDLQLATDLARSAGLAIENLRLYEREAETRRQAEHAVKALNAALREQRDAKDRFETLVRATSSALWRGDASGQVVDRLVSWRLLTGQSFEESLGWGWLEALHEDERTRIRDEVERGVARGKSFAIETTLRTRNGELRTMFGQMAPVRDETGRAREWVAAFVDVTDRRRAEQALRESESRFRAFADLAPVLIWMTDATGSCTYFNRAWLNMTGTSLAESLGDGWLASVHPEDRAAVASRFREAFGQREPFRMEYRLRDKDGKDVRILDEGVPVYVGKAFAGYIGSAMDITERHLAQTQEQRFREELALRVAQRTEALARANAELEAFSYSVSHDLRAPVRAIDTFAAILEGEHAGQLDEDGRDLLRRLRSETTRMSHLIRDLLTLSRSARGDLRRETFDLSALASAAIGALRSRDPGRSVETHVEPGMRAYGDPELLRIVLDNLLSNAWKFTSKTPSARIEVGMQDGAFFVRDNGPGFDPDQAHRLFRPFQRLHAPTQFEGTGLGLATVARIVERHEGRVWGEGRPGKGATFWFTLPPRQPAPAPSMDVA